MKILKNTVKIEKNQEHGSSKTKTPLHLKNKEHDSSKTKEKNLFSQYFLLFALKVFQCLLIGGENAGKDAIRQAESFVVSEDDFQSFLDRHDSLPCLVPESNNFVSFSF